MVRLRGMKRFGSWLAAHLPIVAVLVFVVGGGAVMSATGDKHIPNGTLIDINGSSIATLRDSSGNTYSSSNPFPVGNFPSPYPTSTPGGILQVNPANASGTAYASQTAGADAVSNTQTAPIAFDFLSAFNGTTWDRLRSANTGQLQVNLWDVAGARGVGVPPVPTNDGTNTGTVGGLFVQAFLSAFNGTTSDRVIVCPNVAVVNISSATTTSIVAASGSTKVYVCSYSLYIVSGTLPSFVIEGGTGAACVSTQVPLTGTFGGIAGAVGELFNSPPATIGATLRTAASSALCIVSGGTTPNIQGFITWTQF